MYKVNKGCKNLPYVSVGSGFNGTPAKQENRRLDAVFYDVACD